MTLPTPDAYNDAVQSPRLAFSDPELANGTVECNGFGIPKALGGGFAITYEVKCKSRAYAVRCFHKEASNLQERYKCVHTFLDATKSPLFVGFEYQPTGIKVKGSTHPIVKMEWANGTTLGEYIEEHHDKRPAIEQLRTSFAEMEAELELRGIAHGDLQNGNVLVAPEGAIRLVDYDGIFVPGMKTGGGAELGHKHFQHPDRNAACFGPSMDHFSFLVIDLSLWALTLQPDLFRQFSTGENILFAANDFADPASSNLFQILKKVPDSTFQRATANFASVCTSPFSCVPRLPDFLAGRNIPTAPASSPTAPKSLPKYIGALPVIDGSSFAEATQHVGDKVEIIGRIVEVNERKTKYGRPYIFVNFGKWRDNCVRITLWSGALKALGDKRPDKSWEGQWVIVNGMMDPVFDGRSYKSIGITLSDRSQLHKITQGEALWRLGRGTRPGSTLPRNTIPTPSKNEEILRKLQRQPASPSDSPRSKTSSQVSTGTSGNAPHAAELSMIKSKNEAILKGLLPSSPSQSSGTIGPGPSKKTPQRDNSGCLGAIAIVLGLCAVIHLLVRFS